MTKKDTPKPWLLRPIAKVIGARGEMAAANAMRSLAWEAWT